MSSFALTVRTDGHGSPEISLAESLPPNATITVNGHINGDEEEVVEFGIFNDVVIEVSGKASLKQGAGVDRVPA